MNLKSLSQKLPQTALFVGLGIILSPDSVKASNPIAIPTENIDLSRPTLLITTGENLSVLAENSPAISLDAQKPPSVSSIENIDRNTYSIAKNQRVTNIVTQANQNPPVIAVKSNNVKLSNNLGVKKDESTTIIAQNFNTPVTPTSISIPVELPSQTPVTIQNNNSSQSIPITIEPPANNVNNTVAVNNPTLINIPVSAPPVRQQTEVSFVNSTIEIEKPTLISNVPDEINSNFQPRNNRIINPTTAERPSNFAPPSQDLVSAIPIQVEYYNPLITPSAGQMVSPDLPQINSPEPYLPEGDRPFNGYIWPARGVFTSGYGWRWGRMHKGIDIAAPVGTPIVAAADGEVVSAGWNSGGFGNLVRIRHFDGSVTLYAHNSKIHVRRGQFVTQGQHIANMGSTGFSTGPHLHFEIHPNGESAVNPIALLPSRNRS